MASKQARMPAAWTLEYEITVNGWVDCRRTVTIGITEVPSGLTPSRTNRAAEALGKRRIKADYAGIGGVKVEWRGTRYLYG